MKDLPFIIHVPHSSTHIPEEFRNQFILSQTELEDEIEMMTDHNTHEMVAWYDQVVRFDYTRLLVDVERFWDEREEPMSRIGMGAIYQSSHKLQTIRKRRDDQTLTILKKLFDAHHKSLENSVDQQINRFRRSIIIDLHSYPKEKLPYETSEGRRPELCIGTDPFHTPENLQAAVENLAKSFNLDFCLNTPFSGSLVPIKFYQKDKRVSSIMLEWRRDLYLNDGKKIPEKIKLISHFIQNLIEKISNE